MAQGRNGAKGGETENDGAIIVRFSLMSTRPSGYWSAALGACFRAARLSASLWIPAFAGMMGGKSGNDGGEERERRRFVRAGALITNH